MLRQIRDKDVNSCYVLFAYCARGVLRSNSRNRVFPGPTFSRVLHLRYLFGRQNQSKAQRITRLSGGKCFTRAGSDWPPESLVLEGFFFKSYLSLLATSAGSYLDKLSFGGRGVIKT